MRRWVGLGLGAPRAESREAAGAGAGVAADDVHACDAHASDEQVLVHDSEEAEGAEGAPRIGAEALYRAHAPFVARLLYRLGVPAQELDDLVQQVFLVAHGRGGYALGPAQPTTWLAGIAVRIVSTWRRTARRKRWNESSGEVPLDDLPEQGVDVHRHAEARESLERVARALHKLSDEQRLLFVLHEIEERTCESLARELGLPLGTVHSRLYTARRAFIDAHKRESLAQSPKSGDHTRKGGTP